MKALEVLKKRRSVRKYLNKKVDLNILKDIADCGRLAATARNIQPCRFVIVTDEKRKKELSQIVTSGRFIDDASACILVFSEETQFMIEDGSAATQNILLAAKAHGLGSCWVAGYKRPYQEEVERFIGVPENIKLISCVSVGHEDGNAETPKKELSEVLHLEHWQE